MALEVGQTCSGADIVIKALEDRNISVCFANPGTTEMWLVKALANSKIITSYLCLHETVCAGAADGYARMSNQPALCLLHMGPGLANAIANLHNAKRSRSKIVVVVGDMATWHRNSDAPLCMDIKGLAATVSSSVILCEDKDNIINDVDKALSSIYKYVNDPYQSNITTLIIPHDISWAKFNNLSSSSSSFNNLGEIWEENKSIATRSFCEACVKAISLLTLGKVAFLIGAHIASNNNGLLERVGKIAVKCDATLYCENLFSRVDRGERLPKLKRLPYFPQDAQKELKKYELLVLFDMKLPVAQFGYDGGPSEIVQLSEDNIWEIDVGIYAKEAIETFEKCYDTSNIKPCINCNGFFAPSSRPSLPKQQAKLSSSLTCAIIAHFQPVNAIIVDESITSGGDYWELSMGCPRFSHLTLTGGAIGSGPPLALGAAIACPNRKVINLQADGSAMYSLQAFWTQAKESLNITTIIFSNNSYAILKVEVAKQGIKDLNGPKLGRLTDLSKPEIDWVAIAKGTGIQACRATNTNEFIQYFKMSMETRGPSLIQAMI